MYAVEFLGLSFELDPVAFSIGSFDVYWYGIIIAAGFLAAMVYAFRRAGNWGIQTDPMIDIILGGTLGAIVGARTYYVLTTLDRYDSFLDMIDIRDGGLAIYGGVIGAFLVGGLVCKWRKVNLLDMCDLAAISFLIGQAVGRWGNFMNQEAFGSNTTSIFGMYSNGTRDYLLSVQDSLAAQGVTVDPTLPVHPCFFYESIWCLIGFVLLHFLSKHRSFKGQALLQYIIWYGFGRFFIEQIRTDSLMVGSFKLSQLLAAVCVIAGLILSIIIHIRLHKKQKLVLKHEESNNQ